MEAASNAGAPFQFVLTDMQMPAMDGFQLSERIRANPAWKDTVLVMLSSGGKRGDAIRCRDLNISAYLPKPVKEADLFDAIVSALAPGAPSKHCSLVTQHSLREAREGTQILLAEDNRTNQLLAVRILEKRGYKVTVVGNGKEAVAATENRRFDVVLMDVQMPEMDGHQATVAIREREKNSGSATRLPIIAMTAHAMKGDEEKCLQSGMDGYVSKPVRPDALFGALARVLRGDAFHKVTESEETPQVSR